MFKMKLFRISALIICFFTILIWVSYQRASDEDVMQWNGESILNVDNFTATEGENARIEQDTLVFDSMEPETELFAAPLELRKLNKIGIRFRVFCPEEFTGSTLFVDLCAENYDRDEQGFSFTLKTGVNEIHQVIDKGEDAPDFAQLRVFSLDAAQYRVEELSVQRVSVPNRNRLGIAAAGKFFVAAFGVMMVGCWSWSFFQHNTKRKSADNH